MASSEATAPLLISTSDRRNRPTSRESARNRVDRRMNTTIASANAIRATTASSWARASVSSIASRVRSAAPRPELLQEGGPDLEQVAHDHEVRELGNWRVGVAIDGH